jgi:hypothetical protein
MPTPTTEASRRARAETGPRFLHTTTGQTFRVALEALVLRSSSIVAAFAIAVFAALAGCAGAKPPAPVAPEVEEPRAPTADEPRDEGERIAVPGWVAVLIDAAAEVDDETALERLAGAASDEIARRMLVQLAGEDLVEARMAVMMLMLLEWGAVLDQDEAFSSAEFKRQIVLTTLVEFERTLRGKTPHQQLTGLRCDLLAGQLADLRRLAFASASDLFEQRIEPEDAAAVGAGIRERLDRADARSKELSGTCREGEGASVALANAYIDAGYLLNGDPCDVLTWDLYMLILGADEELPATDRVFGPQCKPNVLVFH